jgi:hypothetical protein
MFGVERKNGLLLKGCKVGMLNFEHLHLLRVEQLLPNWGMAHLTSNSSPNQYGFKVFWAKIKLMGMMVGKW